MGSKKVQRNVIVVILFFAVWISLMPMFFPEVLQYEYSLKHLKAKEAEIEELSEKVVKTKESAMEKMIAIESLERKTKDAGVLRSLLEESEYTVKLDIPSVLVFLEQEANASNAEINIDFARIETYDINNQSKGKEVVLNPKKTEGVLEKAETPAEEESVTDVPAERIWGPEVSAIEGNKIRLLHSVFYEEIPPLEGATVTLIPIMVQGEYSDIGAFIERLDAVEYLEPGYLGTYSTGDEVVSVIGLFVFHKEGE